MQRKRMRNPRRRGTDIAARGHRFQTMREHRKELRAVAERNILRRFPSLEGERVVRVISNFETTPHLNPIERARALIGAYHQAFDVVETAAEKSRVARRMAEIAERLDVDIRTSPGYGTKGEHPLMFTRRRSAR